MQPGPLSRHPQERSRSTPSFRLIDFGRSNSLREEVAKVKLKDGLSEAQIKAEEKRACHSWSMNRAEEEMSIGKEFCVGFEHVGS